jgi:hypothetical protein
MSEIRKEDLDQLAAELLPERAVLGTVAGSGHHSTTVAYACQGSVEGNGNAGLVAALVGSGSAQKAADPSLQCFPAAIVNNH